MFEFRCFTDRHFEEKTSYIVPAGLSPVQHNHKALLRLAQPKKPKGDGTEYQSTIIRETREIMSSKPKKLVADH